MKVQNYLLYLIYFISFMLPTSLLLITKNLALKLILLFLSPGIFIILFCILVGSAGYYYSKFLKEIYLEQNFKELEIYIFFWEAIYNFTWIYGLIIKIPFLKNLIFKFFGYQSFYNFNFHSNVVFNYLPLIEICENSNLKNNVILSPLVILSNQKIILNKIVIGKFSNLESNVRLFSGVQIGNFSEIQKNTTLGIKCRVSDQIKLGAFCTINQGSWIENNVKIGAFSYLGIKSHIRDHIIIEPCSFIPSHTKINNQSEYDDLNKKNTMNLVQSIDHSIKKLEDFFKLELH